MLGFGFETRGRPAALAALLVVAAAVAPMCALAQSGASGAPSYAVPPTPQETIRGRVASFDGAHNLQLNDDRGFVDNVRVGNQTVIAPNGTRLQPGMRVTIVGVNRGSVFAAVRIEAQQTSAAAPPPGTAAGPPPGTELKGIIGTSLDSKNAYVGESVVLTNVSSLDGAVTGATLSGTVTNVVHPGQGRNAQIGIHFDSLRLPDGTTYPIDGEVASMQVNTKNNAAKEVGGALAGMLVGNALAKTVLGVSGGGIVGAVGGFLVAKDNRTDVTIPANTAITVRLVVPRRQAD